MGELKIGDIVARKSYGYDIFFKVVDINDTGEKRLVTLKGISYRIQADAPEDDLVLQPDDRVKEYRNKCMRTAERKYREIYAARQNMRLKKGFYRSTPNENTRKFSRPGKVLHLDGDSDYLSTCLTEYRKLGINAVGECETESKQPARVRQLLEQHKPDILVLTGHDGVIKDSNGYVDINNYANSKYFVEGVREARKYDPNLDGLVIFAGACQSMYKEILNAGANYASSPYRVLIHALDPVLVCQKIAYTSINKILEPREVISNTITGEEGIGGLQTRGKYRDGFPLEPFN